VVGLATDYCVLATVLDGLKLGFEVFVVTDAMRAVNVEPEDGAKALSQMSAAGAHLMTSDEILEASTRRHKRSRLRDLPGCQGD
jgi:nicotinamidase/pyrazinamidase